MPPEQNNNEDSEDCSGVNAPSLARLYNQLGTIDRRKLLMATTSCIVGSTLGVKRSHAETVEDVYASRDLASGLPKAKFPLNARAPDHVYQAVRDELGSRLITSS